MTRREKLIHCLGILSLPILASFASHAGGAGLDGRVDATQRGGAVGVVDTCNYPPGTCCEWDEYGNCLVWSNGTRLHGVRGGSLGGATLDGATLAH
jgi:hypothetical protein